MIIALTGAGISQESGIPTFEENPELRDVLTRDFANENPINTIKLFYHS